MKNYVYILKLALLSILLFGCAGIGSDVDQNGNSFASIKIGEQYWMAENLNIDRFRNGDVIPEVKSDEEWIKACENKQPAWCYYDNDPANGPKFGKLYNWYAVIDPRGVAPSGWHVPNNEDWVKFKNFFEYSDNKDLVQTYVTKLKSKDGWKENNGSNELGFNAKPAGHRGFFNYTCKSCFVFDKKGEMAQWWSTSRDESKDWDLSAPGINYDMNSIVLYDANTKCMSGFPVRCIRE